MKRLDRTLTPEARQQIIEKRTENSAEYLARLTKDIGELGRIDWTRADKRHLKALRMSFLDGAKDLDAIIAKMPEDKDTRRG